MPEAGAEQAGETCPKCGYQRRAADTAPAGECPACGIIYEKFRERQALFAANTRIEGVSPDFEPEPTPARRLWETLWLQPEAVDPLVFYGSAVAWTGTVIWGLWFILQPWNSLDVASSFLHRVNLPFHEFGHILFGPFGRWMMFLGGSLFQCLVPLILAGYFLFRQRQPFSASVCLWWCAQNFIDVAPYIGDASTMALPLTGEWNDDVVEMRAFRHDWHNILEPLGLLQYDHRIALISKIIGAMLMVLAWSWGAMLLRRQWERVPSL
jgi:hypothetical protein